jgi:hypothetical protein
MEVNGQLHSQAALPQGKSTWYPLDRRPGGPQSRPERGGEEKNSQLLPGLETPIIKPVVHRYTTELSRLLYRAVSIKIMLFCNSPLRPSDNKIN